MPWIEWASAAWLFLLGLWLALRGNRTLLEIYIFTEGTLALPTALYVAVSFFGGAGHLSAGGAALAILLAVFSVFTCVPLAASAYLLAKKVPVDEGSLVGAESSEKLRSQ